MEDFSVILSRDDPFSPKPSPEGVVLALKQLGVPGHKAGAITAFLTNQGSSHPCAHPSDFTLERLDELRDIVGLDAPLPA